MFVQYAGQARSLRAETPLSARLLSLRCCLGQTNHIFSAYNLIHLEGSDQTQRFHAVSLHIHNVYLKLKMIHGNKLVK